LNTRTLLGLAATVAIAACVSVPPQAQSAVGSWFWKEGASRDDITSRRLLIGVWHSEATDIHGVTRIEDATRFANGTYMNHFVERSETGKVTGDQIECGRWGVSGNIYFTITQSIRQGDRGTTVSPYDASFYDAYAVLSLTKSGFEYRHVATGQTMHDNRVSDAPKIGEWPNHSDAANSPCEGTST
jgi:hypothetical protein